MDLKTEYAALWWIQPNTKQTQQLVWFTYTN